MAVLSNGYEAAASEYDNPKTLRAALGTHAPSLQARSGVEKLAKATILKLHSTMCKLAMEFMLSRGFQWIHTPRITDIDIEGDNEFFELNYFGKKSTLTQATQFHKQQLLTLGLDRVFDIGPLFRAESRVSTRHMTEFTGLEFEMAFDVSYTEAIDTAVELLLFVHGFESDPTLSVARRTLGQHHGAMRLPGSDRVPRISFRDAKAILRADCDMPYVVDDQNFSAEEEAALATFMRDSDSYARTDLFVITDFPSNMRGFWSVPDPQGSGNARAFDIIFRGQEIVSGSQHIDDYDQLCEAMRQHSPPLDPTAEKWKHYVGAFKNDTPPHAGCGIGMNRVLQGVLGLRDVREATAFPRDAVTSAP